MISALKVFTHSWPRRQDAQGSRRLKRRCSFYLIVISFLIVFVIKASANERLLASGISFFHSYRFGISVKGNSIVLETYPSPRRQNFPEVSYPGKSRWHLKNQVSLGKLSTSLVYLGKRSVSTAIITGLSTSDLVRYSLSWTIFMIYFWSRQILLDVGWLRDTCFWWCIVVVNCFKSKRRYKVII